MTSWARVKDEQTIGVDTTSWAHVDEPENEDELCDLCCDIDRAYDKYKQRKLYFGNFYDNHSDQKTAQYLFAVSEMQKCMGELSNLSCDIFKGDRPDCDYMEKIMGKMLFYMEVAMMSYGKDLTDARDECKDICRAIARL